MGKAASGAGFFLLSGIDMRALLGRNAPMVIPNCTRDSVHSREVVHRYIPELLVVNVN